MNKETGDLSPSGFTNTTNEVYDWLRAVIKAIDNKMDRTNLSAGSWSYRVNDIEVVCLDFWNDKKESYSLTFQAIGEHDYGMGDVYVPDLVEAWHMIGMICHTLDLKIEVGRIINEINPYCTEEWTSEKQTNAKMKLDF